jgi:hypothetical protein
MDEQDFRHSIEDMLRLDQVDEAVDRLRALLQPCSGVHETLPPRFLEVTSRDVEVAGWHRLADRLLDHDRPHRRISAIGVTLADARVLGGPGPSRGRLSPFIKTFYFNDDAYPFSDASRDDLLDGYSRDGFEWQGDYQATDATLSIKGIDDLHGAIVELEDRLLDSADPDESDIRAGTIGACYLATLIHQALRNTIREKGLPRPLCVLAACDGVYPFFEAPVVGSDQWMPADSAAETAAEDHAETALPDGAEADGELAEEPAGMASLLSLVSNKGAKAPVMVLTREDAEEALRYAEFAEAQRVGVADGHALNLALAESQAALRAEAMAQSGEPAWGDVDLLERGLADQDGFDHGRTGDVESFDEPEVRWQFQEHEATDLSGALQFPEMPDHAPETSQDFEAEGATVPDEPPAPPASHSLRARFSSLTPEPAEPSRGWVATMMDWFRRSILRR